MTPARTVAPEAMVRVPAGRYNVRPMATSRITWEDVQQMPDDGRRREAIAGGLCVSAAPSARHQEISVELAAALHPLLVKPKHGRLFHAPGVEFPETGEGVQPDLVFVSGDRRGIVADDWIRGAPDLVVEILSPSTEERDRGVKRKLYRRRGMAEYWIVDPEEEAVEVWRFGGGTAGREADAPVDRESGEPAAPAEGAAPEAAPSHERFTGRL
ncbi:MAG: Uma2 family endonuclease, partial [Gemmatimonadota bacterium]